MNLERDIGYLRDVPLFSALDEEQLRLIAFNTEHRTYRDGQFLFRQGDLARSAFIILSGEVEIEREHDGTLVSEGRFGPGTVLGETAMIISSQRPAGARAEGAVEALEISRAVFRRMLDEYPETATELHALLRGRLADLLGDLGSLGDLVAGQEPRD